MMLFSISVLILFSSAFCSAQLFCILFHFYSVLEFLILLWSYTPNSSNSKRRGHFFKEKLFLNPFISRESCRMKQKQDRGFFTFMQGRASGQI